MASINQIISMSVLSSILITGCGGGGGGGSTNSEPSRRPETLVYLSPDQQQLIAAADDASVPGKILSGSPFTSITQFAVSPDGEYVAYIADQDVSGQMNLYVAEIDGDAAVKLSQLTQAYADVEDFKWSPDSGKLAYRADDGNIDDRLSLYSVNVDGSGHFEVAYLTNYISSVFVDPQYSWSPDSNTLAWILDDSDHRLFSLWTNDTRNQAQAASSDHVHFVGSTLLEEILSFKWSPDSQTLAFRTDDFSNGDDQYIIAAVAADNTALAFMATGTPGGTVQIVDYAWSPDSGLLAQGVHGYPDDSIQVGINTYQITGMTSTRIANTSEFGELHWAHLSNKLAFVADFDADSMMQTGELELIVYDADTMTIDDLNHDLAAGETLSDDEYFWSPDDSQIAYLADLAGSENAYIVASDGNTDAIALPVPANRSIESLSWGPYGNQLGLLSLDENTAFHPGNWHLFDKHGLALWSSADLFSFDSSQQMKWSSDIRRAIFSGAGMNPTTDALYSLNLQDLSSSLVADNIPTDPAFDLAQESLVEEQ